MPMNLMKKLLLAMLMFSLLTACDAKPKMLGITGYNYTNRYIDTFSVDGQGGGNVLTSEGNAGGGGTVCCMLLRPDTPLPVTVHVEWTYGYEKDFTTGQLLKAAESHQADVDLSGPVPEAPTIFVVHFYPDNTVQVEVAADYPKPRVQRSSTHSTKP